MPHTVKVYRTRSGEAPISDYIRELGNRTDKDSRIKLNKIYEYIEVLKVYGKQAGEPYLKHLEGEIWELRPIRDRILFATWEEGCFILLHLFIKKTQKTPKKEIEQAKRNLLDYRERSKLKDKKS
jgi:phage-related protein